MLSTWPYFSNKAVSSASVTSGVRLPTHRLLVGVSNSGFAEDLIGGTIIETLDCKNGYFVFGCTKKNKLKDGTENARGGDKE